MNKSDIVSGFNNHIIEFFNDVLTIFPNDTEISIAHTSLLAIRKINPTLAINIWKKYISDKYKNEIEAGNINFFIDRNYQKDLKETSSASKILSKIDTLREPIKQMVEENKQKTIIYIQNLTKLCNLYYE